MAATMTWAERERAERAERNAEIVALRQRGLTYEDISRRYNITRERVHQIVVSERRRRRQAVADDFTRRSANFDRLDTIDRVRLATPYGHAVLDVVAALV